MEINAPSTISQLFSLLHTINTFSDHRNVNLHLNFIYAKVEKKTHQVQKEEL